jgi:hypothetical protein
MQIGENNTDGIGISRAYLGNPLNHAPIVITPKE